MGVPHLTANLKPYATKAAFTGSTPDVESKPSRVVIDGPAFAHHIYQECLKDHVKATDTMKGFPSYEAINDAAVEWLNTFRTHSFTM